MKADLPDRVRETVRRYGMLQPGDTVIAAVSGGADSVAMLACLLALREPLELAGIEAVHVHHGLRGEEADRDEAAVRSLCERLNVPLTVFHRDVAALAKERGDGIEEAGREARYACFEELRAGRATVKIATAHTRSDQAETVLLSLVRGSGTRGLGGIHRQREGIIRPLLDCSRRDTEDYCRAQQLAFVTDSTNADPRYRRNFLRLRVLPLLRELNPKAEEALSRLAESAAMDDACLNKLAEVQRQTLCGADGTYDAAALAALPDALLCRVLAASAAECGGGMEARHLRQVMQWLRNGQSGALMLPGDVRVACSRQRCGFGRRVTPRLLDPSGDTVRCGCRLYTVETVPFPENEAEIKKVYKNLVNSSVDCDKIKGDMRVDFRRAGDRFQPAGAREKELRQWQSEKRLPCALRDLIPLLRDEAGIVWVPGLGAAARVVSEKTTRRFLVLRERGGTENGKYT